MTGASFPTAPYRGKPDGFCHPLWLERFCNEIETAVLYGLTPKVLVRNRGCEQYAYGPLHFAEPGNRIPPVFVSKVAVAHDNRYLVALDQAQGQIAIVRPKEHPAFLLGNCLERAPFLGMLRQSQQFQRGRWLF